MLLVKKGRWKHEDHALQGEQAENQELENQEFCVEIVDVDSVNNNSSDWILDVNLNGTMLVMQANILSHLDYQKLQEKPLLKPTVVKLRDVDGLK